MSELLTGFTGSTLYLDTMIPYALLRGLDPAARDLFVRIEAAELQAYTSVLTFDELSYRMLLALIRDHYEGSPFEHLRDNQAQMIAQFYSQMAPHMAHLRAFPNLFLVDVTSPDLAVMDKAMRQYHIRPRDALHLAAMQKCGCLNLVSHDSDFDRVPQVRRYTLR
ncbi:MAG: type II toxin-antitoxin system VapC family toxin [Anaerolineae bacterium]|nr:type II toxin-antitoxin system VapC family toxin [Anaerolineae bacterium]